jgi:hypothetical protein
MRRSSIIIIVPLLAALGGCLGDEGEIGTPSIDEETGTTDEDLVDSTSSALRLTPGVNGRYCVASPFNCRFRQGSSRVTTAGGDESWGIAPGASVRDGNGTPMIKETRSRLTFNYGQTRLLAGKAHALALSTSNGSAGWYPIDHILGETSFRARNGEVNAKDPGRGKMACYEVRSFHDPDLELKKVVYDSTATHERAGDYLPLPRENGQRSVNLVFSVPGFGLGGATTDHFPAGTRFQRVDVPTSSGRPSISIPLWVKDGSGRYRKQSGTMRFLYGYVRAEDGVKRWGWMAQDALEVSSGCP